MRAYKMPKATMYAVGLFALCSLVPSPRGLQPQESAHSLMRGVGDADRQFLRAMIDHHESLIYLVHEAMQRTISKSAHEVLDRFDVTEDAEKQEMAQALQSLFAESYSGRLTAHDKMEADSLLLHVDNPSFDRMASAFVVAHHRRGVQLINRYLDRIERPRVRELAVTMRKREIREIAFHQRRLAAP